MLGCLTWAFQENIVGQIKLWGLFYWTLGTGWRNQYISELQSQALLVNTKEFPMIKLKMPPTKITAEDLWWFLKLLTHGVKYTFMSQNYCCRPTHKDLFVDPFTGEIQQAIGSFNDHALDQTCSEVNARKNTNLCKGHLRHSSNVLSTF